MQNDTVGRAPDGQVPILDSRFGTHNTALSSALCALGFHLRTDAQPVSITIDADTQKPVATFFHQDTTALGDFSARVVDLWWNSPKGKYTIEGYDDALTAMRRVHVERSKMLQIAKRSEKYVPTNKSVLATQSIHAASIMGACEIPLIGYDPATSQWIFGKGAEVILTIIKRGGKPKDKRPLSNDLCIDWMLESLRFRDWLMKLLRDPENIPVIEMRDGERVLQISRDMNPKDASRMIHRF